MGQEKIIGYKFTETAVWSPEKEGHPGGYKARFAVVHEGREQEAENLVVAFKSAGGRGTHIRDGVVGWTQEQMEERMSQVEGNPKFKDFVADLDAGIKLVQRLEEHRLKPKDVAPQAKAGALTA